MTTIILATPPTAPATSARSAAGRYAVYLPIIGTPNPVAVFYRSLATDARQQRANLERCKCLEAAAQRRAHGLVNGDPWDHVDAAGVTPNEYARAAGCQLPADYAIKGNEIESLCAGSADPAIILAALANSTKHAPHLFGHGWFNHQRHMGIAMAEGGELGWYWVILIALCEGQTSGE